MTLESPEINDLTPDEIIQLNTEIDKFLLYGVDTEVSGDKLHGQVDSLARIIRLQNAKLTRLSLDELKAIHGMIKYLREVLAQKKSDVLDTSTQAANSAEKVLRDTA